MNGESIRFARYYGEILGNRPTLLIDGSNQKIPRMRMPEEGLTRTEVPTEAESTNQ